jgi:RNA polymerase sigma factor (sigma-70 family)
MASHRTDSIIQHLRRAVLRSGAGLSDSQLLESFITDKDAAAFEALVRRHGRMVQGVCLRVLRHRHDAEDAFQATFLVLAHKAVSVCPRDMLGNWLYGVANTTALRAKVAAAKRQAREKQVSDMPEPQAPEPGQWDVLQPLLDQELTRLPDKYRIPIVLCDLEGRPRREVASQLKIPEGTLSSRLTTARRLLAKRLTSRGMAVSGAALAALVTQNALSASVPPTLVAATVKAVTLLATGQAAAVCVSAPVLALKEGVLKAMFINKLKTLTTALVMLGIVTVGAGLVAQRTRAAQQSPRAAQKSAAPVEHSSKNDVKPMPDEVREKVTDFTAIFDKPLETERPLSLREAIAIAVNNAQPAESKLTRLEVIRGMHNLLLNVEVAYWNLYEACSTLYGHEEGLRALHKSWMDTHVRAQEGFDKSTPDVLAQIRGQFEESRVERSTALEEVVEAERNLRGFLGLPVEDGRRLVPVTPPTLSKNQPNWEAALRDALSRRPELLLARENLRIQELALIDEKNIDPKNRSARLQLAQAFYVLKNEEEKIERNLTQQFLQLGKWYRLIEDRRAERKGYADALKAKITLVELGKKSVDLDLLDNQRRLALAHTKEIQAIAGYNNTLARLDFARGTIMQRHDVVIGEKNLTPIVQIGAVEAAPRKIEAPTLSERPAGKHRVHLVTEQFEADCDRLTGAGNSDHMILEGDVQLTCKRHGELVRIQGERVQIHLKDGTFSVESTSGAPRIPLLPE